MLTSPTTLSDSASAAAIDDASTLCGACGHMTENAVVSTVSVACARTSASAYSGCPALRDNHIAGRLGRGERVAN